MFPQRFFLAFILIHLTRYVKVDIQIEQDQFVKISVNNLLGNQINILNNKKLSKG